MASAHQNSLARPGKDPGLHSERIQLPPSPQESFIAPPDAAPPQSAIARALLRALDSDCRSWCILSGYEDLPERFDTDIDFMVGRQDFSRIPALIDRVATHTGTRLFLSTPHEPSARAFLLAAQGGAALSFFQLDAASDYRHFGRLWLRAAAVLTARRLHPRGFWIPAARHEFLYYLIKRLNKRDFRPEHAARLSRLYAEDPAGTATLLRRFWSAASASRIEHFAASAQWTPLVADLEPFRRELWSRSGRNPVQRIFSFSQNALNTADRLLHPTGCSLCFMGPDGCGKSTVIEAISAGFAPVFTRVERFHLRPHLLKGQTPAGIPVVDPHGKPPRGWLASVFKMAFFALDYIAGSALRIRPAVARTRLVIFDRYFQDILVDTRRFRYGGPRWLPRLVARLIPRPGLTLLLNAPPEVLWSRKQEVPFDEVVRQQKAYLALLQGLPSSALIDAAQPVDAVVRDVTRTILDYLSVRTAHRLKLPVPAPTPVSALASLEDRPA
jgi:thymidylate kinase